MNTKKLNVTHLITGDLWAGAEAQAYSLITELAKSNSININVVTFNNGILVDKLSGDGISVDVVSEKSNNSFKMIWLIYNILKKRDVDILHSHGYKETLLGGLAARISRAKCIIRTHHGKGVLDAGLKYKILEKINRRFFTDHIISVSKELKAFLVANGFDKQMISVITNGIAVFEEANFIDKDVLKKELNINKNSTIIGTMGRLDPVKGHKYFLKGAEKVILKDDNVVFLIAGDGPQFSEIKDEIYNKGLESKIILLGFRNDAYDILNLYDIFILTSLHEGIPMVLLEAMSMGKAIIATNVGGIPEIISNHQNGLLIPSMDSNAFYNACIELMNNKICKEQIGKCAKEDIINKHLIKNKAKETLILYRRAAAREENFVHMGC